MFHGVVGIVSWIVFALLGGYIAAHKGYSPRWGVVAGIFLGPIGVIIVAVLPRTADARETAALDYQIRADLSHSRQTRLCPQCGRENSVLTRICPQCDLRFAAEKQLS
jgi:hypothetical protein